jgi:hypothetical protein
VEDGRDPPRSPAPLDDLLVPAVGEGHFEPVHEQYRQVDGQRRAPDARGDPAKGAQQHDCRERQQHAVDALVVAEMHSPETGVSRLGNDLLRHEQRAEPGDVSDVVAEVREQPGDREDQDRHEDGRPDDSCPRPRLAVAPARRRHDVHRHPEGDRDPHRRRGIDELRVEVTALLGSRPRDRDAQGDRQHRRGHDPQRRAPGMRACQQALDRDRQERDRRERDRPAEQHDHAPGSRDDSPAVEPVEQRHRDPGVGRPGCGADREPHRPEREHPREAGSRTSHLVAQG